MSAACGLPDTWTAVMNVCVVMVPDAEQQCEGGEKRSWWECALPADEEGNYIVTSSRCVRAHKITADSLARLSEIMLLISDRPASFFETTWRWTEHTLKTEASCEPMRVTFWADRFATVAYLIAATDGRLQLSFWWKCQLKFNLEVTPRLLWHWYLFWSPHRRVFRTICVVREDLVSVFLDHTYSRLDFPPSFHLFPSV